MSSESPTSQLQKYLDFGSLDSSSPPDLSLNSLHQPKLSLQLDPTDLSFSLPDITTCSAPPQFNQPTTSSSSNLPSDHSLKLSQQLAYDLNRHPSKRWTSFSELGKSVLRLKSFERSTVHGSTPYIRPRISQIKPASIYSTSTTTTTSASNHRHLFKLFHPDQPINPSSESVQLNPTSTLPILPPLSELFDGSTSFDKELASITNQPITIEEAVETSQSSTKSPSSNLIRIPSEPKSSKDDDQNGLHLESQSQKDQSIVSSQSSPIVTSTTPSSPPQQTSTLPTTPNQNHQQVEKSALNEDKVESSPPAAILIIEEPTIEPNIDQAIVSQIPTIDPPGQAEVVTTDDDVTTSNKSPCIDILSPSDESKSNEDPTSTTKLLNSPTHNNNNNTTPTPNTKNFQNDTCKIGNGGGSGFLGKKKKFSSESSSFFKLLFLKGLGHLKSSHSSSVHNDTSSKTLVPTSTIHNH